MLGDINGENKDLSDPNLIEEPIEDKIPPNDDFACCQNVKNRMSALLLLLKFMFRDDGNYKYFAIDGGSWTTMKVSPRSFLSEGTFSI